MSTFLDLICCFTILEVKSLFLNLHSGQQTAHDIGFQSKWNHLKRDGLLAVSWEKSYHPCRCKQITNNNKNCVAREDHKFVDQDVGINQLSARVLAFLSLILRNKRTGPNCVSISLLYCQEMNLWAFWSISPGVWGDKENNITAGNYS